MRSLVYTSISAAVLAVHPLTAQETALNGTVTDAESGTPLPGANIRLVDTLLGATTDLEGRFVLPEVPAGTHQVEISLIGYEAFTDTVQVVTGEQAHLTVVLTSSPVHMGETLIQADRAFSAASSRAVRQFDLQTRPTRTAQQMLQLAPGLIIAQHAGGGKAEQIFLRGEHLLEVPKGGRNCKPCTWTVPKTHRVAVSTALRQQPIGLEPIDDGVWEVWFGPLRLGRLDERQLTITDALGKAARRKL